MSHPSPSPTATRLTDEQIDVAIQGVSPRIRQLARHNYDAQNDFVAPVADLLPKPATALTFLEGTLDYVDTRDSQVLAVKSPEFTTAIGKLYHPLASNVAQLLALFRGHNIRYSPFSDRPSDVQIDQKPLNQLIESIHQGLGVTPSRAKDTVNLTPQELAAIVPTESKTHALLGMKDSRIVRDPQGLTHLSCAGKTYATTEIEGRFSVDHLLAPAGPDLDI
jgi:hypothetical protein